MYFEKVVMTLSWIESWLSRFVTLKTCYVQLYLGLKKFGGPLVSMGTWEGSGEPSQEIFLWKVVCVCMVTKRYTSEWVFLMMLYKYDKVDKCLWG